MRALVVLLIAVPAAAAVSQSVPPPGRNWEISASAGAGAPSGWVQVRENSVDGTRLGLGGDLNVHEVQTIAFGVEYRPSERSRYALTVSGWQLDGSTTIPAPVYFNGTTLAGGTALLTRTRFANFLSARITGSWRVATFGGGELSAGAGLDFVALNFVVEGTLAAGSATRETREDFVTQELPVPIVGADYRLPVSRSVELRAALGGGYLPWVNSLRQEGGTVTITQSEGAASVGARYRASTTFAVDASLRYATLTQREQSGEDGNEISVSAVTLALGVAARF